MSLFFSLKWFLENIYVIQFLFSSRYPVGPYDIHILDQINDIVKICPSDGILQFKDGSKLFGIVKAILVPPKDISPYFAHDFGTKEKPNRKYCVCFSCANGKENLKFCHHKDRFEKAITGKSDIKGFKILKFFDNFHLLG